MKAIFKLPSYLLGKFRDSIPKNKGKTVNKHLLIKKAKKLIVKSLIGLMILLTGDRIKVLHLVVEKSNGTKNSHFEIVRDTILNVSLIKEEEMDTTFLIDFFTENF